MENSSHNYVRIENAKFGYRGMVYTSLVFIITLLICVIIGVTGPPVLQSTTSGAILLVNEHGFAQWQGKLESMSQLNQIFWLTCIVSRNDSGNEAIYTMDIK